MKHRFLIVSAAALALFGCSKSAPLENELVSNITPIDENGADASLNGIVEVPADDGDAPNENALPPVETHTR